MLESSRSSSTHTVSWIVGALCVWPATAVFADDPQSVDFARDVQPIFAAHCLNCHGPDDAEGGLQLHSRQLALKELDSGERAITPKHPDRSELLKRVTSEDPDLRMPPEGESISEDDIRVLQAWIRSGADWSIHWAYRPLDESPPPVVQDIESVSSESVRNEIDHYVIDKLRRAGFHSSPEADRYTLIKRLYYDLVGLPPEPKSVDAFVQDPSDDAYEKLVDELLASPHFGERWGRHWLDKARYADSDGYEKDNHRPDAWRYRDWVIRAINNDMPYDQFTVEQLAGDMLPGASPLQRLATAFNRQTLTNTEGGTDNEQWRVAAVMDRTETLGTVWLGLSVGCARCHNHKYDQISQSEYYQLFAYFNNADETNDKVPQAAEVDAELQRKIAEARESLAEQKSKLRNSMEQWLPQLKAEAAELSQAKLVVHPLEDISIAGPQGVSFERLEDGSYLVTGENPSTAKYTVEATTQAEAVTGIRLEVLPDSSLHAGGPGRTEHGNFVLNEIRLYSSQAENWTAEDQIKFADASADYSQKGWPVTGATDGVEGPKSEGTGSAISPQFGKPHQATFTLPKALDASHHHLQIVLSQTYGSQHAIGRFRLSAITGAIPGTRMPERIQLLALATEHDDSAIAELVDYQQAHDPHYQALNRQLKSLESRAEQEWMDVRILAKRNANLRSTHILRRGEFKQPLDEVTPGTLATLPPIRPQTESEISDRLDMARWLVDGRNPLVPRVAANHVWKHLFGEGLVTTVNDFGVRGDPPSHPKLLDHLAVKLIQSGWSRKELIKYIVMSATYRQSSQHRIELEDVDATNRLLHRQNRFRVEAEIIRDIVLAASGLLSRKVGGPSVFPPIPPSVTDLTYNSSFQWKTSEGPDRYRRGMYTYFKRTAPHPNLTTFDCPDSNVTNVQRERSNTPIGALVTLNNDTFVEAAQAMASLVLTEGKLQNDHARLQYALRRCIARVPTADEVAEFAKLLKTSRNWYEKHPEDSLELIGGHAVDEVLPHENAAWVATLRIMLNLDEFVTRE